MFPLESVHMANVTTDRLTSTNSPFYLTSSGATSRARNQMVIAITENNVTNHLLFCGVWLEGKSVFRAST